MTMTAASRTTARAAAVAAYVDVSLAGGSSRAAYVAAYSAALVYVCATAAYAAADAAARPTETTAMKIAARYADGMTFEDSNGARLEGVCFASGAVWTSTGPQKARFQFDDGSAITVQGDWWEVAQSTS